MRHTKKYVLRVLRDRGPIVAFHGATPTASPNSKLPPARDDRILPGGRYVCLGLTS